jgi:hypothetical protein
LSDWVNNLDFLSNMVYAVFKANITEGGIMKKDIKTLTLRIPQGIHTKAKILGAINNQSITKLFIDLIEKADLKYPDFEKTETVKTIKAKKRKKPSKPTTDTDKGKLERRIVELKSQGASQGAIAKMFTEEGLPTLKGGTVWNQGTIGTMIQRLKKEGKINV